MPAKAPHGNSREHADRAQPRGYARRGLAAVYREKWGNSFMTVRYLRGFPPDLLHLSSLLHIQSQSKQHPPCKRTELTSVYFSYLTEYGHITLINSDKELELPLLIVKERSSVKYDSSLNRQLHFLSMFRLVWNFLEQICTKTALNRFI